MPVVAPTPPPPPAPAPPPLAQAAAAVEAPEAASAAEAVAVPEGWLTAPQMNALARPVLNAYAASKGLEGADGMPNKGAVATAVLTIKELRGE